ncbi:MAG: SgcJ/EcaC family oxidoreductase [Chloroflexota bacterium]
MIDPRRAAIDRPEHHQAIALLYRHFNEAWNRHDAESMARLFDDEAELISRDGRSAQGAAAILALLQLTFRDDATTTYVAAVTRMRKISFHVGVLHGCMSAIRPGETEIDPERAMLQTLVTSSETGEWQIASFQSTPVQLLERPDLLEALRGELRRGS